MKTRVEKIDLRTLSESERLTLCKLAIGQIKSGKKKKDIAADMGIRPNTITDWDKQYQQGGYQALKSSKSGPKEGTTKLLSPYVEDELKQLLVDKMPDQFKLSFSLWTRRAVKELIKQRYHIDIAITTVGEYLRSWGFTPQRPKKRAYERQPKQVQKWLDETYPQIKKQAKMEGAEIHWGDETGVKNNCNHGRSYSPKGKTPVKISQAKKISLNMISTITNQGKVRFMIYEDKMDADLFIEFLRRLVKGAERKTFLILDNLRVHHSKRVKSWVEKNQEKIQLFFLPSYSPELNPDEYLNCDLKGALSNTPAPKDKKDLKSKVRGHMKLLQRRKNRVKSYFKHCSIKYAA